MKRLALKCGLVVLLDDEDFEAVSRFGWHVSHNGYAIRRERLPDGRKRVIYMHCEIFGAAPEDIDHADGSKLNNCRANLRPASRTMNNANSKPRVGCSSPFKGVAWVKSCKRWWAYINRDGKRKPLGYFSDEIEAAKAYNTAAINLFGEFARLNPV
jgi:hypothetical protein